MWEGLEDGTILLTGSDDCTFDVDEKSAFLEKNEDGTWKQDFTKVVNGISGIEIRLPRVEVFSKISAMLFPRS